VFFATLETCRHKLTHYQRLAAIGDNPRALPRRPVASRMSGG
jgi:hypothetical protein